MNISRLTAAAVIATAALATTAFAASPGEESDLLDHAVRTAEHMKTDPAFQPARDTFHRAKAVLIIPGLVKGGFIFGAEGGNGVLLERMGRRGWSPPAFYVMGSASFGLQAGLEKAEIVLLVMSDRALAGIEQGDVKLGVGGGLTVVTLSGGAEAATPANLAGDIVAWTSASGLYGGITLNGSVLKPLDEWNADFYGHSIGARDILHGKAKNKEAAALQHELATLR